MTIVRAVQEHPGLKDRHRSVLVEDHLHRSAQAAGQRAAQRRKGDQAKAAPLAKEPANADHRWKGKEDQLHRVQNGMIGPKGGTANEMRRPSAT